MAAVAIVGESGTGKSSSIGNIPDIGIKGLNPKETVIINVAGKDLPFLGWMKNYTGKISEGGNYLESASSDTIAQAIKLVDEKRPEIKNIIIDDGQYTMAFEFMNRAKEAGYGKFSDIGVNFNKIIQASKSTRKDLKVYFLWHPERDANGRFKMKTVGKMVDDYLTPEGLFTVLLYSKVMKDNDQMKYKFVTNNDGEYPAKTPIGMFKDMYIPNDLGLVSEAIDKFNGLN